MRRRHTAGSAPGSPEGCENWNLALANDLVELLFVDFDGFAYWRQLSLASTAYADIGKVLGGNAIGSTRKWGKLESAAWIHSRLSVERILAHIWHTE